MSSNIPITTVVTVVMGPLLRSKDSYYMVMNPLLQYVTAVAMVGNK